MYDVSWRVFGGAIACAEAVCEAVVEAMEEAIARRGQAVVALSGGGTPRVMLSRLGEEALDWTRVTMVLVDERWCDHDDEHSNFKMISAQLEPPDARDDLVVLRRHHHLERGLETDVGAVGYHPATLHVEAGADVASATAQGRRHGEEILARVVLR